VRSTAVRDKHRTPVLGRAGHEEITQVLKVLRLAGQRLKTAVSRAAGWPYTSSPSPEPRVESTFGSSWEGQVSLAAAFGHR